MLSPPYALNKTFPASDPIAVDVEPAPSSRTELPVVAVRGLKAPKPRRLGLPDHSSRAPDHSSRAPAEFVVGDTRWHHDEDPVYD
jgi:hypothetical protein